MRCRAHSCVSPASAGLFLGLSENYSPEITNARSGACQGAEPAGTGLAAHLRGEEEPANTDSIPVKVPRSVLAFDVAAALFGHTLATVEGAAAARHDHRVWDAYETLLP